VADLSSLGRDRYYNQVRDTLAVQGSMTKLTGRHSMKSGFDFRIPRFHLNRNLNSTGTFSFNRAMTQGPDPLRATAIGGFGAASLLLGAGAGGNVTHTDVFTLNRQYYGLYFQENWKLTNRFTLNLGIRYSLEIGQNESHDRIAYLDLDSPNPLGQKVGLPLRGLLGFVGRGGVSRNMVDTDKNNFGPRVGFAWRLGENTVVRSGYGVFYAPSGSRHTMLTYTPVLTPTPTGWRRLTG
jgi:outer membrane receptor protein involved in Fe transport